jgi:Spy/CpxP family protein refolding chaperone
MKKMSGKQRKKLANAINHMTPEQRQQFTALLKQQLGETPQAPKRGR